MTKKHTILTAINSKYIHSNLAVYCLRAYAKPYIDEVEIAEYTINQQVDDILMSLYQKHPDILCFSCYIWNIEYIERVIRKSINYCRMFQSGLEDRKFPMMREKS